MAAKEYGSPHEVRAYSPTMMVSDNRECPYFVRASAMCHIDSPIHGTHLTVTLRLKLDGRGQLLITVKPLSPWLVAKPRELDPSSNATQFPAEVTLPDRYCPAAARST